MFLGSTKADVRAAFGPATVIAFDNGYEIWAYDFGPPQKPRLAHDELVLLFDRSDSAVAVRTGQSALARGPVACRCRAMLATNSCSVSWSESRVATGTLTCTG